MQKHLATVLAALVAVAAAAAELRELPPPQKEGGAG